MNQSWKFTNLQFAAIFLSLCDCGSFILGLILDDGKIRFLEVQIFYPITRLTGKTRREFIFRFGSSESTL